MTDPDRNMTSSPSSFPASASARTSESLQESADERLRSSHRVPVVATCVFVLMMLAIWLMGRQIGAQFDAERKEEGVERVRSDRP